MTKLLLLLALALGACAGQRGDGGLPAEIADRVMVETETDAERVMRLQFGIAIISEVFRDRADQEPGQAGGLMLALDRIVRATAELDADDVFLNTEIDRALDAVKGALGTGLKGRLVQLVKAAAGSWGARIGLARDLVGGVGRVRAMLADLDRAVADVAAGRKSEADIEAAVRARIRANRARLRVLAS